MQTLFTWIAYGLAALFFVACVVAWYEHLGRTQRREDEPDWESPLPKAMSVDVELDALSAEAQADAAGDVGERRQALGGAMTRMASSRGNGFGDTTPMILPGSAAPATGERRQRDKAATS